MKLIKTDMQANEQTLRRFYTAFASLDADRMASCYAEDARFDDPAFSLKGRREISGMWHMLCQAAAGKGRQDWQLNFSDIRADSDTGQVHWEATYSFSATRRRVHNVVEAQFTFSPDGLITGHRDQFDFWRWSRQALGMGGWVLGWAPFFQTQVRRQTRAALDNYLAKQP